MDASRSRPKLAHQEFRRALRYLWRVPLLLLHILLAIPLAVLTAFLPAVTTRGEESLQQRVIRWWSRGLLRIFGFRVSRVGAALADPVLFVANHVSWLDIELLHTQRAACFVAKAEIARWPLVGWLAARAGTLFHRRGSTHSLSEVMQEMVVRLRDGRSVAVFPEGGTGDGLRLRTFHARILQAALDAEVPVQPVALRYARAGHTWPGVAFAPGESFLGNFLRLLGEAPLQAEVHFLEPVQATADGRRRMADSARARIAAALGLPS